MRKSIAERLAAHRAETDRLLRGDAEAVRAVDATVQAVERLEKSIDEDAVILREWSKAA